MTKYEKAPDNQPTDNIRLQHEYAQNRLIEWRRSKHEAERRLKAARGQEDYWIEQRAKLAFQLEVRKAEEHEALKEILGE